MGAFWHFESYRNSWFCSCHFGLFQCSWLVVIYFFLEHFLDNAYCSVLFFVEFDFTAARGMGALNKELTRENVPLYLLKPSKEIIVILKESTNADIPTLDNPDDLESLLEQSK